MLLKHSSLQNQGDQLPMIENVISVLLSLDGGGCNPLQSSDSRVSSKTGISTSISLLVMVGGHVGPSPITFN